MFWLKCPAYFGRRTKVGWPDNIPSDAGKVGLGGEAPCPHGVKADKAESSYPFHHGNQQDVLADQAGFRCRRGDAAVSPQETDARAKLVDILEDYRAEFLKNLQDGIRTQMAADPLWAAADDREVWLRHDAAASFQREERLAKHGSDAIESLDQSFLKRLFPELFLQVEESLVVRQSYPPQPPHAIPGSFDPFSRNLRAKAGLLQVCADIG